MLQALAVRRAAVLASASRSAVDAVAVPGSPVARRLTTDVRSLARRGLRYDGLALQAHGVRLLQGGRARAAVEAQTDVSSYAVVDRHGRVLQRVPQTVGPMQRFELVRGPAGWRLRSVEAA
ncbi:hypothetical protein [Angustibacter aerolatus]